MRVSADLERETRHRGWMAFAAFLALLANYVPACAQLIINPTYDDASITAAGFNATAVHTAFNFAAQEIQNNFSDPIHININVVAGVTSLGASNTNLSGFYT